MGSVGLDNSYLNRKVCHLSGGEQQKVALVRMMLKPYELVQIGRASCRERG